ncbi:MAG: hypothetical protein KGL02_03100 [Acidobacteriota bacterium]|nr:hypothetical protein [Acidobacteriota bacterium]MDE3169975.1 hypothetical protein [Acidobacteriota bacterium]
MNTSRFSRSILLALGSSLVFVTLCGAQQLPYAPNPAPEWSPSIVKACDRACLVNIMDGYTNAIFKRDPSQLPTLARDVRFTENSARLEIGQGMLWLSKVEPTSFKIIIADPVYGEVAEQARVKINGQDSLIAVRLKVDRDQIEEIEHLYTRGVDQTAIPLLTTPRADLVEDVPPSERTPRDVMIWAANSYFDALEGDDGKIADLADDCVRHENGYQTVNNPPPGGRMMPSPNLPNPNTAQGQYQLKMSMMTCSAQISTKILNFITKIRPRRVLVVDEQKGVVATFPLFVEDGTRRGQNPYEPPPAMMLNLDTMETFGIRGGKIHEIEAFPFVILPYGLGNGWTEGSGH